MGINPDENKRWWSLRTFPKKSSVCFLCNLLFPPRGVSSVLLIRRYCVSCKKRRYSCLPQVPLAKCVLPVGHAISVKKNVNCETGEWSHKAKEPGEMGETARIQKLLQTLISDQTVQHNNLFLRLHIKHTMYLETDEHCYSCSLPNDPRSYNFSILINHLLSWFRQEIVVSGETGEVCSRGWEAERISHVTPVTFTK